MNTWTYYKGFDEEPTEIEPCEGHFWRVSPEGAVETAHEDDTEWHPQETPLGRDLRERLAGLAGAGPATSP